MMQPSTTRPMETPVNLFFLSGAAVWIGVGDVSIAAVEPGFGATGVARAMMKWPRIKINDNIVERFQYQTGSNCDQKGLELFEERKEISRTGLFGVYNLHQRLTILQNSIHSLVLVTRRI